MPNLPVTSLLANLLLRRHRALLASVIFWGLAIGQVAGQEETQHSVRYLGLKEGLSSRDVKDIYQDKRGMVWIATTNGLNRYDGRRLTTYSNSEASQVRLPSSHIRNIAEDDAQNLLLCTNAGLIALDPSRRHLVSLRQLGFPDSVARQTNCRIDRLPGGKLLLLSGSVLYHYAHGRLTTWFRLPLECVPAINSIRYSIKDSTLYLQSNSLDIGLLTISGKPLKLMNHLIQYKWSFNGPKPAFFFKQSDGLLINLEDGMTLAWQNGFGIRLQNDRAAKRLIQKQAEQLSDIFQPWLVVQQYLGKLDEAILPGSMRGGFLRFWLKDEQGVYWLGTNIGVFMVAKAGKSAFRQFDFLKNISIRSIIQDEAGNLLIGTYSGLFKYDPDRGYRLKMPKIRTVLDIAPVGNNRYWMAMEGWNGLNIFDNTTNCLSASPAEAPALSFVFAFAQAGNNTIWMAPRIEQVYCLHIPDGRIIFQTPLKPYPLSLQNATVKTILTAKDGSIWIASEEGLYRLVPEKKGNWVQDMASIPPMLRKLKINALYEDRSGRLWIGTDGQGLAVLSPGSGKLQQYKAHDGLAHNIVYSILGSHRDSLLWAGTQNGLSCLSPGTGLFSNYHQKDGLADNEFNSGARGKDKEGCLYFGGINGITYFKPEELSFSHPPLKAFLSIEMPNTDREGASAEWFPLDNETLLIPASETYFEILFSSNAVFEADDVRYRYTISGLYDDWQYSDAANKLVLRNLSPGHCTLKVQAITSAGQWSAPFKVTLNKLPYAYQTWWFRALIAALVSGIMYGAYLLRVWQIQREYEIRNRIVHDLHDDLGSRLFAMRAMASKIAAPKTKASDLSTLLAQFEATNKNAYAAMRDFIWAFDPKSDGLKNLVDRMSDFAENTVRPLVPELKINDKTAAQKASFAPAVKHHALMVFQEILTNATKHTFSTSLAIDFLEKGNHLCIRILNRHDGLRNEHAPSEHKGKESIDARLKAIKGQLEWLEKDGVQEISICIPFLEKSGFA
ncbi:MAG: two-component regulator propeller domain-containing protein [Saprospiraceae bacterium]